jgi:hypothetical protein
LSARDFQFSIAAALKSKTLPTGGIYRLTLEIINPSIRDFARLQDGWRRQFEPSRKLVNGADADDARLLFFEKRPDKD